MYMCILSCVCHVYGMHTQVAGRDALRQALLAMVPQVRVGSRARHREIRMRRRRRCVHV